MSGNVDRRRFLGMAGTVTGASLLASTGLGAGMASAATNPAAATNSAARGESLPLNGDDRLRAGYAVRLEAARRDYGHPFPQQPLNGDEKVPGYVASYVKGFPHDDMGEVDPVAYRMLLHAVSTGRPADFAAIPLGLPNARLMLDPQAMYAVDLEGPDSHGIRVPAAPGIGSAENAAEMAELYWMAMLRDVSFTDYETSPLAEEAAASLSGFGAFTGPRVGGKVTPATLFRGSTPGDLIGPFISQFMLADVQYGTQHIRQLHDTVKPGLDYLTDFPTWLAAQRGAPFALTAADRDFVNTRFLQKGRDLAHWVHFDQSYQTYLMAALILLFSGLPPAELLDAGNPYVHSNQQGFATFGAPHILQLIAEVSNRAVRASLFQQWGVQRRIRPEETAGRIEIQLHTQPGRYDGMIAKEILESDVLDRVRGQYGSFLLPQAFPEGSPMSPDYPSGHSTLAGAATTLLKAWFNESTVWPNPVAPDAAGTTLVPYTGSDAGRITIGGELNKMCSNIGAGRDFGGVHYRSAVHQGFALGESIAIGLLTDQKRMFNEDVQFTLTRFDGTTVTI